MSWWESASSSSYGAKRSTGAHQGKDFPFPKGTPITPIRGGIALVPPPDSINGNYVVVYHPTGYSTSYLHLDKVSINDGTPVGPDTVIGLSGNTGRVRGQGGGYHVHLGVRDKKRNRVNPDTVINNPDLLGNFIPPKMGEQNKVEVQTAEVQNPEVSQPDQAPFDVEAATEDNMISLLAGIGKKKKKNPKAIGILSTII